MPIIFCFEKREGSGYVLDFGNKMIGRYIFLKLKMLQLLSSNREDQIIRNGTKKL